MSKRYKYKIEYTKKRGEAQKIINELTDIGWELDKFHVTYGGGYSTAEFYLVMKKEK